MGENSMFNIKMGSDFWVCNEHYIILREGQYWHMNKGQLLDSVTRDGSIGNGQECLICFCGEVMALGPDSLPEVING